MVKINMEPTFLNQSSVKSEYYPPNNKLRNLSSFPIPKSIFDIRRISPVFMNIARNIFFILDAYSSVRLLYLSKVDNFLKITWIRKFTNMIEPAAKYGITFERAYCLHYEK